MKRLDGIPESMLIPLIARAKEYEYEKFDCGQYRLWLRYKVSKI